MRRSIVILALLAAACDGGPGPGGTVRGVVRYDGAARGTLRVAVFPTFPPSGAPIAVQDIEEPVFPQAYEVRGVPEGRYFVLAIVDVDPRDGANYRPLVDPGGAFGSYRGPASVQVGAAEGAANVDVDLVDPSASSPWATGRYR